ncbi:MAG TPA: LamG-like jellyroll fold domain-containing protein, partial [Saprospiraceae bacterium]|nr:LamG-like jellyroll fold domain-containing protein [Saprospiraceae bacterium]
MLVGSIYGLRISLLESGANVGFLKIRLKNTDSFSTGDHPDETGLQEVYHKSTDCSGGALVLPFYQPFDWTGQNLLVDISFTTENPSDVPGFEFFETITADAAIESVPGAPESNLFFGGTGTLDLPQSAIENITDEITVAFWAYGDPALLPANTQIVDGTDAGGQRQATIHLPWSNGEVYWDCGNDGTGYDRINKPVPTADFEGRWSHWAFTKNTVTGVMNIFLNGQLFHSGTGKTKKMDFDVFRFGQSLVDSNPFFGAIDEIQVWDKALDESTISSWLYRHTDASHPQYDHLLAYYQLNEGSGNIAGDASGKSNDATLTLPTWREPRGNQLFHNFSSTNHMPVLVFLQGDYTIADEPTTVLDSVESALHQVIHYGVSGTDLIRLDTQYVYPAGDRPVFDESGVQVDVIQAEVEGTIQIQSLQYYAKRDARFELLSLVTPYGIGLDLGPAGKTFTFDVTDFGPVLKGRRKLSVEFGGENQEELDIQFWFITGTPERDVLDIQPIWPQARGYFNEIQSDLRFEPRQVSLMPFASHYKVRSAITGHEQNGEFVSRQHYINVKGGSQEFLFDVWKSCSRNPIYPQGGTWIFDRAGWCPGMATDVHEFSLDGFVEPSETVEFDYGINGPAMGSANYLVNNLLVTYGAYNFNLDASIEAIVRPNNTHVEYARLNPACNTPTILVKNSGEELIESVKISYGTTPWNAETYFWVGDIEPQASVEIVLPQPPAGFWQEGGIFTATIVEVNGVTDGNDENNIMQSTFDQVRVYDYVDPVQLRVATNATGGDYFYTIKDGAGSVVLLRNNMASNTVYTDDLMFPNGCYTLNFRDSGEDGLSFWFFPENGNGSMRIQRKLPNGNAIPVYSFEPDFGGGVQYDFHIGALISATEETDQSFQLFSTYPNPTMDELKIDLLGFEGQELTFKVVDMNGTTMFTKTYRSETGNATTEIDLSKLVPGMYVLHGTDGKRNWVREVVKTN